ncbi:MAG: hypothetical protein HY784_18920 [Chloroflexi bacterium]|nr:hypothetical protein [Chloroflexota bacterium]
MPELVDHKIQASNVLLGESRFFTLRLPPEWTLAPGVSHPEITASHERRAVKWVAAGSFWYVLVDQERRRAMEFHGHLRPASGRPLRPGAEGAAVGGHPAEVHWKTRRRGPPWRRHDVTFMTVECECPQSERRLKLELSGWCPEASFREILASLAHLRCH